MKNRSDWYDKILDEFHKERNTQAFYKTKGFKKLWNYIYEITKKESFQNYMQDLRDKYKIPVNGFQIKTETWTHPPEEWIYSNNRVAIVKIRKKLRKFCLQYQLSPKDWLSIFESYLFYNELQLYLEPNSHNLCLVSDLINKTNSLGKIIAKDEIAFYPVALQISPYASKRDILDYIQKIYKTEIKPMQEKFRKPKINIGKYRTKKQSIQQRNNFIYENRNLPKKEIMHLLSAKYDNYPDYGEIGKIISLETKRRK